MATATHMFSHNDRRDSSGSDDQTPSTENRRFVTANTHSNPPRPGQHLDDADLLAWKHQYMNIGLREQNVMSNSADDLTQLVDHEPFEGFRHDYNDIDDEELHFDNGNNYDYETSIHDRLKKANEDLKQDETPAELRHKQRVSFDVVVKAVDIEQDSQDLNNPNPITKPPISPVEEEALPSSTSPQNDNNPHEYTVPLNDTQPKEGPTLLQQLKAMQFHGIPMIGERWSPVTSNPPTNSSSSREGDLASKKANSNNNSDIHMTSDMTTKSSTFPQKSMVVAINGGFEIQNEDDYTAKGQIRFSNDEKKTTVGNAKSAFVPTPPTEAKQRQDPSKPPFPHRPYPSVTRPKSSDSSKRTNYSNNSTSKSWNDNANKSSTRPKSAGVSKSMEPYIMRPLSGVDFDALNRKAAAEKREREQAELLKQKAAAAERKIQLDKAKESFEKWVHDKDAERKRFAEEKRLEKEEHDARQAQCEKELAEKREKRYQEWIERKNREVMLANEFKKLQADDEESEYHGTGSTSSIHGTTRRENHRAFHRWLRRKYEQSREEQRQLRLEARRLRRRQRRSIKRFQLQQDLQLAKSFGYS